MTITIYDLAGAEADRRFSPFCWRSKMALAHKGLAVETVPWRFTEKDRLPQPNAGRVPVIVDGERVVHDSTAIADYLEERYPDRPSLFGGASGRALTRFVQNWTETVLQTGLIRLVVLDIHRHCALPVTFAAGRIEIEIVASHHQDFAGRYAEELCRKPISLRPRLVDTQHLAGDHCIPPDRVTTRRIDDQRQAQDREGEANVPCSQTRQRRHEIGPSIKFVPALRNNASILWRDSVHPLLGEQFVEHVAMHVVDIMIGIDGAEHPAQRTSPVFVGEAMPIALDAAPRSAISEHRDKATVPVEDRAPSVEGQHLDLAHSALLSPHCARALPAP